jgi:hypothetical protein
MLLQPLKQIEPNPIERILSEAGLRRSEAKESSKDSLQVHVRETLNIAGASLEDAAISIASALRDDENPQTKLKAAELTCKLHGALKEAERPSVPSIIINLMGKNEGANLFNLLVPREISI